MDPKTIAAVLSKARTAKRGMAGGGIVAHIEEKEGVPCKNPEHVTAGYCSGGMCDHPDHMAAGGMVEEIEHDDEISLHDTASYGDSGIEEPEIHEAKDPSGPRQDLVEEPHTTEFDSLFKNTDFHNFEEVPYSYQTLEEEEEHPIVKTLKYGRRMAAGGKY